METASTHANQDLSLWLAFVLPSLLFWVGLFWRFSLSAIAVVATAIGVACSMAISYLLQWADVANVEDFFPTILQACIVFSVLAGVFFFYLVPFNLRVDGTKGKE